MAVSAERFAQGMTVEQYKAQMTQNRDRFEENEAKASIRPEDREFFAAMPQPLNVLVITEDWCGDALANVPVLAKLADATGKLNLRLFLRDKNLDLADSYLKEGKYRSVPVFVFFDAQMNELGHFIERPARATAEMAADSQRLAEQHPELPDLREPLDQRSDAARTLTFESLNRLRAERGGAWTEMLLDDVKQMLSATAAR